MRFLIDMPLTPSLTTFLRELGHDAIHAADIGAADAADATLLFRARAESRVVITAYLDSSSTAIAFGYELRGYPSKGRPASTVSELLA